MVRPPASMISYVANVYTAVDVKRQYEDIQSIHIYSLELAPVKVIPFRKKIACILPTSTESAGLVRLQPSNCGTISGGRSAG